MPMPALPLLRNQFLLSDAQTGLVSSSMRLALGFSRVVGQEAQKDVYQLKASLAVSSCSLVVKAKTVSIKQTCGGQYISAARLN